MPLNPQERSTYRIENLIKSIPSITNFTIDMDGCCLEHKERTLFQSSNHSYSVGLLVYFDVLLLVYFAENGYNQE